MHIFNKFGLQEAGEEGAGGGTSKASGSQEKWEKFCNIGTIFCNRKSTQRREPLTTGAGTGSAGCGKREVQTPPAPPPPPPPLRLIHVLMHATNTHMYNTSKRIQQITIKSVTFVYKNN